MVVYTCSLGNGEAEAEGYLDLLALPEFSLIGELQCVLPCPGFYVGSGDLTQILMPAQPKLYQMAHLFGARG